MIACVIGKCLVMGDADLFIICRQRAPDTENPIWITQLIRITSHKPGLATTNCTRDKKCVQYHREKLLVQKKPGTDIKNDRIYCRDFPVEVYFSQLTPDVRITTQSDQYQANLTESHRTWLNLAKRPSYNDPESVCHHPPCLYSSYVLLEFFDNIIYVPHLDGDSGDFALKSRGHCFDISLRI